MGGICVWLGFTTGIIASIFVFSYLKWIEINLAFLLAGFSTIAMVGFLGVIDDLIGWKNGLRQWQHALIPVFAALPLMAIKLSNPPVFIPFVGFAPAEIIIPFVGVVSFGLIYSLIFVPIGVTGASNAANMLAGLNGLEAGLGAIISATMLAIALTQGQMEAAIVSIAMLGALIAFLRFNWYPAKVFGGDSLTLMIGASIATAAILGNMEKIGVMLLAIYFVELVLKARFKMQREGFGIPTKEGILHSPKQVASVTHVVMRMGSFTEKRVVEIILTMQIVLSIFVASMSYFKLF
jgi:UDP-N-acetylglucosamine--dolichyl-phosphate N-acetylglucosaminephosphotransferase